MFFFCAGWTQKIPSDLTFELDYKIRASVFGSYHVRPGGYILEEADSNIPIGNEIIFGGGLGLNWKVISLIKLI